MNTKRPLHILFATPKEDTIPALSLMVKFFGWTAEYVTSATQMINAVNINSVSGPPYYDAIVSSIAYDNKDHPGLTGVTAGKLIRRVRQDVPILFVSEYNNSILREEVRRIGDAKLLAEPDTLMSLFNTIEQTVLWHSKTTPKYKGKERRRNSINRSGKYRRFSDELVSIPDRLQEIFTSAAHNGQGGH